MSAGNYKNMFFMFFEIAQKYCVIVNKLYVSCKMKTFVSPDLLDG